MLRWRRLYDGEGGCCLCACLTICYYAACRVCIISGVSVFSSAFAVYFVRTQKYFLKLPKYCLTSFSLFVFVFFRSDPASLFAPTTFKSKGYPLEICSVLPITLVYSAYHMIKAEYKIGNHAATREEPTQPGPVSRHVAISAAPFRASSS